MSAAGISSLKEGEAPIPLIIRVIRKWNPRFKQDNICYLFIDKQHVVIQAIYSGKDQQQIDSQLLLNQCFEVNDYACTPTDSTISIIDNPLNLRIEDATAITRVPNDITIPAFHFSFSENKDLLKLSENRNATTDYAGILTGIDDKITRDRRPYVNLKLVDSSNYEVQIQLWSEILKREQQFNRSAIEQARKPVAVAVTSVKYSPYTGSIGLQATSATHVYIQPKHPTIEALLRSYKPELTKRSIRKQSLVPNAEKTTITNLFTNDSSIPPGKIFLCAAHIAKFLTDKKWFYRSCPTCFKTTYKTGDKWWCLTDGYSNDAGYTYRIDVSLSDNISEIKATMFNTGTETLINKPCRDLVVDEMFDDQSLLPYPILEKTGQRRQFLLKSQASTTTNNPRYIIEEVLNNEPAESSDKTDPIDVQTPTKPTEPNRQKQQTKRALDTETEGTPAAKIQKGRG